MATLAIPVSTALPTRAARPSPGPAGARPRAKPNKTSLRKLLAVPRRLLFPQATSVGHVRSLKSSKLSDIKLDEGENFPQRFRALLINESSTVLANKYLAPLSLRDFEVGVISVEFPFGC